MKCVHLICSDLDLALNFFSDYYVWRFFGFERFLLRFFSFDGNFEWFSGFKWAPIPFPPPPPPPLLVTKYFLSPRGCHAHHYFHRVTLRVKSDIFVSAFETARFTTRRVFVLVQ